MTRRLQAPLQLRLDDEKAERVRRNHDERLRELQAVPIVRGNLVRGVELESGVETPVPHGLGRAASVFLSPPLGATSAGRIERIRSASHDPARYVVLKATGWGATITVDAWCF